MARKTFDSMRVRGAVRFDSDVLHQGRPLVAYRLWTGLLSQVGANAPSVVVVQSTLGVDVDVIRAGVGHYVISAEDAFPEGKVVVLLGVGVDQNDDVDGNHVVRARHTPASDVDLYTQKQVDAAVWEAQDGLLKDVCVEIRVYA